MDAPLVVSVPDDYLALALGDVEPRVEVLRWDLDGPAPRPHIDLVVPPYLASPTRLRHLEGVSIRLVQSQSIGYDGVAAVLPPGITFANAASVHEASTAELAVALILAAQRGLDDFVRAAARGTWSFAFHESLADRTVLLLGYGGVGRAIAARLQPFEVNLLRVARHARVEGGEYVHASENLPDLLGRADVVVVSLPLTPETTHLIDATFLARLRDHTLVVNVGRGPLADTDAVLAEAASGRLRFALDVVEPEPLPDNHPLFALANVLISPHVGGATSAMAPRVVRLVREQIERLQRGEEPINVVVRS